MKTILSPEMFEKKHELDRRRLLTYAGFIGLMGCLPKGVQGEMKLPYPKEGMKRTLPQNQRPIEKQTLKGCFIAITVGHGLNLSGEIDFGAINQSEDIAEYLLNTRQAEILSDRLSLKGATVDIFHYREGYKPMTLFEQGQATSLHNIHVSLHHNYYTDKTVQGSETLVDSRNMTKEDLILAGLINQRMVSWTGVKDRKVKEQSLGILRGTPTHVAKCLTEPFFISETGMTALKARQLAEKSAIGISEGIELYWAGRNKTSSTGFKLADFDGEFSHFKSHSDVSLRALPTLLQNDLPGLYDNH